MLSRFVFWLVFLHDTQLCSVSLSNQNVYACLVCGKYFQGRGKSTHAYTHSVQHSHHVFIHLDTCRIYCLPDSYEVQQKAFNYYTVFDAIVLSAFAVCNACSIEVQHIACSSLDLENLLKCLCVAERTCNCCFNALINENNRWWTPVWTVSRGH
jgi:Zn-finger in ubiquitin-hydrolases and other protein